MAFGLGCHESVGEAFEMTRLDFGPLKTKPILFLHGFPGVRSRQNRDIAVVLSMADYERLRDLNGFVGG